MPIWSFWTNIGVSSDYIVWGDLLIQWTVACTHGTGLEGKTQVWGQLLPILIATCM